MTRANIPTLDLGENRRLVYFMRHGELLVEVLDPVTNTVVCRREATNAEGEMFLRALRESALGGAAK